MTASWLRSWRALVLNLLLSVCSLLLCLLLSEAFVRVAGLQPMRPDPPLYRPSAVEGLVYELIPGLHRDGYNRETVTTDANGFRSPALDPARPVIAVVGDSMAFGFGVEDQETNPARLAQAFPDYSVVNAGVSGYNMEQEVIAYETKVAPLDPVMVILEFVINDADPKAHYDAGGRLTTENLTPEEEAARLRAAITRRGTWRIPGKAFLHENSALFTFIERRTKGMWFRAKTDILAAEWTPDMRAYYRAWFERLSASVGGKPKLLVRWPDNWLHPETVLMVDRLAQDHGWRVLDLGDLFGNHYPTLGWDHHPTADAHAKAAEAMVAYIRREGLLPASGLPTGTGSVR